MRALEALGAAEAALGDERDDVEVGPPQRRGDGEAQQRAGDDAGVERPSPAPTPIATIDSPSAMMMISPKRSARWPGLDPPALDAEDVQAAESSAMASDPESARGVAVESAGATSSSVEAGSIGARRADRPTRAAPGRRAARPGRPRCAGPARGVGDAEEQGVAPKAWGTASEAIEHRRHRRQQRDPDRPSSGARCCPATRSRPRPPQHDEDRQALDRRVQVGSCGDKP